MLSETQKVLDFIGGADADRTRDLLNAIQALSQLSYSPTVGGSFPAKLKPDAESILSNAPDTHARDQTAQLHSSSVSLSQSRTMPLRSRR